MTDRTNHCTGCKERQDHIEALTARIAKLEAALGRIAESAQYAFDEELNEHVWAAMSEDEMSELARAALGDTQ